MKFIPSILLFFFLLSFSSCSTKTVEPELPDANPPAPVIPEEPIPEKEKMLWFDAEANFERFSKKENITYYLDLAKSTGFNKIVVDVRPVQGDALFKSSYLTPLTDLAGIHIERDWDYLQFFIDEAHKRELKVTVSTTIFTAGLPSSKNGMAYRDDTWNGKTCLEYTKDQGLIDIKNDKTKVSAFLNPVLPEVQDFCLNFMKELVTNYDFDGFALDYCRYPGDESDFSETTKVTFEQYIGKQLDRFPDDIFTWNTDGTKRTGAYYKKWWEFRSMVVQKEKDEKKGWTVKNDPRVTPIGKFIRKTSIDELPQLFNILKGDMSLVGPRPERPLFVEKFKEEIPRYMIKHQVRPGLTGWAQVNGYRGDTSIRKRIEYDLYYIENWTLGFDIKIILLTFLKGFINKNAY